MKRGQATVFMILAIVIAALVGAAYYYRGSLARPFIEEEVVKGITVEDEIKDVGSFLEDCVKDVTAKAIEVVPLQGGFWKPSPFFIQGPLDVGYWYYQGKDESPTIKEVEREISEFVNFYLPQCMDEYTEKSTVITPAEPETHTRIKKDMVIVESSYPATIIKEDGRYKLPEDPVMVSVKSEFKVLYDASKRVLKMEKQDPAKIQLSALLEFKEDIVYIPGSQYEGIYIVTGMASNMMFATKYG